jgi:hypothetical protein
MFKRRAGWQYPLEQGHGSNRANRFAEVEALHLATGVEPLILDDTPGLRTVGSARARDRVVSFPLGHFTEQFWLGINKIGQVAL